MTLTTARELIRNHPSYRQLLVKAIRYVRSCETSKDRKDEAEAQARKKYAEAPETLLRFHCGVLNDNSKLYKDMKSLAGLVRCALGPAGVPFLWNTGRRPYWELDSTKLTDTDADNPHDPAVLLEPTLEMLNNLTCHFLSLGGVRVIRVSKSCLQIQVNDATLSPYHEGGVKGNWAVNVDVLALGEDNAKLLVLEHFCTEDSECSGGPPSPDRVSPTLEGITDTLLRRGWRRTRRD